MQEIPLIYTICFCCCGDRVLVLYRRYRPNQHRWNGLGGKIEEGETPLVCVQREIWEEAEIDLGVAACLHYAGIVTWNVGTDALIPTGGMYAFIAYLPTDWPIWEGERESESFPILQTYHCNGKVCTIVSLPLIIVHVFLL